MIARGIGVGVYLAGGEKLDVDQNTVGRAKSGDVMAGLFHRLFDRWSSRQRRMILHPTGIAASVKDPDYADMAFIDCGVFLSRPPEERLIEVMVFDQINRKTDEVSAQLYRDRLVVRLSDSVARDLKGVPEYVVQMDKMNITDEKLEDIDRALQVIFAHSGSYERCF